MPRERRTRSGRQSLPYSILRVSVPLWFDQTVPVSGTGGARGTHGHACLEGQACHPGVHAPASPALLRVSVPPMKIDTGGTSQNEAERSDGRGPKGLRRDELGTRGCSPTAAGAAGKRPIHMGRTCLPSRASMPPGSPAFSSSGATDRHDN